MPPPRSVCHGCHLGEIKGAPQQASRTCDSCHAVRSELKPSSHGPGWDKAHGAEVRLLKSSCTDCHDLAQCTDCHDERGAMSRSPHPAGWRSVHGVEARFDPTSCLTCHTADTCSECHETGRAPW